MLYISTRNNTDTYTAHRALHEEFAPDNGFFVPFYLPTFSQEALKHFKKKTSYENIADILNLFFSLRLTSEDLEIALGKSVFSCENLTQNVSVVELWHSLEGKFEYILKKIYQLLSGNFEMPKGWPRIAISISVLFGLVGTIPDKEKTLDFAVTAEDLGMITAVSYAKAMGLPVGLIICACDDNSVLWDLVNKGDCNVNNAPYYMELFLYKVLGGDIVSEYLAKSEKKRTFMIDEVMQQGLAEAYYPAVVSTDRADSIISGIYRSNQYAFDVDAALSYGSLQDYRAIVGINKQTLIFVNNKPIRIKE